MEKPVAVQATKSHSGRFKIDHEWIKGKDSQLEFKSKVKNLQQRKKIVSSIFYNILYLAIVLY